MSSSVKDPINHQKPSHIDHNSQAKTSPATLRNLLLKYKTMKTYSTSLLALLVACARGTANAWGVQPPPSSKTTTATTTTPTLSRQDFLHGLVAGIAATAALLPSNAAAAVPFDPSTFSHQYSDPKHPNCKRIVVVKPDTGVAAVSGTDGNPGCDEDGDGTVWRLVGEVEGNKLLVDFSAKGGPKNLKGVWEGGDTPGIRWPDGNKWTVKN